MSNNNHSSCAPWEVIASPLSTDAGGSLSPAEADASRRFSCSLLPERIPLSAKSGPNGWPDLTSELGRKQA
jgi:hypothetical protein